MMRLSRLLRDPRGATAIELAFALPIFLMMVWAIFQFGLMFRAMSGMQHALGEGARYATLYPKPTTASVKTMIEAKVYGIRPGTFTVVDPVVGTGYLDLQVTYTQPTDLIFVPGPTISVSRTKRVWVAS